MAEDDEIEEEEEVPTRRTRQVKIMLFPGEELDLKSYAGGAPFAVFCRKILIGWVSQQKIAERERAEVAAAQVVQARVMSPVSVKPVDDDDEGVI